MVWLGWALSLLLLAVGFLGVWLPAVPGLPLMALGAFIHKLLVPGVLSWWTVGIFAAVAALGFGVDFAATALASRRAGATKAGVWGAVVGGLLGLFFGLPGLLLGPVLGAAAGELVLSRRSPAAAVKSGLGAALGVLAGSLGKGLLGLLLLVLFALDCFVF
ncbi:MAG: DUF456 family protein [Myxococcaceae bacterium]